MQTMLVIAEPFAKVTLDIMGPLLKTTKEHQCILVLMGYAIRYPKTILLR